MSYQQNGFKTVQIECRFLFILKLAYRLDNVSLVNHNFLTVTLLRVFGDQNCTNLILVHLNESSRYRCFIVSVNHRLM